jgi:site-specific recombinase XerD
MYKKEYVRYLESKCLPSFTIEKYVEYTEHFLKCANKEQAQITEVDVINHLVMLKKMGVNKNTLIIHFLAIIKYFVFLDDSLQSTENYNTTVAEESPFAKLIAFKNFADFLHN